MLARREIRRISRQPGMEGVPGVTIVAWEHVKRICEEAGVTSDMDILRESDAAVLPPAAPTAVLAWAIANDEAGGDPELSARARTHATRMMAWPHRKIADGPKDGDVTVPQTDMLAAPPRPVTPPQLRDRCNNEQHNYLLGEMDALTADHTRVMDAIFDGHWPETALAEDAIRRIEALRERPVTPTLEADLQTSIDARQAECEQMSDKSSKLWDYRQGVIRGLRDALAALRSMPPAPALFKDAIAFRGHIDDCIADLPESGENDAVRQLIIARLEAVAEWLGTLSAPAPAAGEPQEAIDETRREVAAVGFAEDYIKRLRWAKDTPDSQKSYIIGNIRAAILYVLNELRAAPSPRPTPPEAEETTR